jgi:dinuclear metal center YbgI/SA1388 family protein
MTVKDICKFLEDRFPISYKEDYDNCGLLIGNNQQKVSNILVTLDCTDEILDEAIKKKCELIICHHPIIFKGLKKLTEANYTEKIVSKAIKNEISIYAIHTNLDNHHEGVNKKIAEKLGLVNYQILAPKKHIINKLTVHSPINSAEILREALFEAGAGDIGNYSNCSFNTIGEGTFKGNQKSNPTIGEKETLQNQSEIKIEVIFPLHKKTEILQKMLSVHPYEEVSYEITTLENFHQNIGSGMFGHLEKEMKSIDFIKFLKERMQTNCVRHTNLKNKTIKTVAFCGGSGSFLLANARRVNADIYISADFKYHEFFDSENDIIIADIGHYESEQFTLDEIPQQRKYNEN